MYLVNSSNLELERENLTKLFLSMDKNGDHTLSQDELREGFTESGLIMSDTEFEELFTKLDANKNGTIGYTEFLTGVVDRSILSNDKLLEDAFNFFDSEKKGYIKRDTLKDALGNNWMGKMQLNEFFEVVDSNNDEKVYIDIIVGNF